MGVGKEGTGWDGIERKNLKRVKEEIVRAERLGKGVWKSIGKISLDACLRALVVLPVYVLTPITHDPTSGGRLGRGGLGYTEQLNVM